MEDRLCGDPHCACNYFIYNLSIAGDARSLPRGILAHDTFAPMRVNPTPTNKRPAANTCHGCGRKIPDNRSHCGRDKCAETPSLRFVKAMHADDVADAIDAMHRQRGAGPFAFRYGDE